MPNLILYHYNECSYCGRVRDFLKDQNISISMKNTRENPKFREELVKLGGKPQVPCLVIDGQALYESDKIIEWIKTNVVKK